MLTNDYYKYKSVELGDQLVLESEMLTYIKTLTADLSTFFDASGLVSQSVENVFRFQR